MGINIKLLINALFPAICVSCGKNTDGAPICENCFLSIKINSALFCGLCSARLPCGKKICHKDFPYVLGAACAYENTGAKGLIHSLKFRGIKSAAKPLGNLLIRYADETGCSLKNFVVVPVPLSSARLRERGFNQAELIAEKLAHGLRLPIEIKAIARIKNSKPQSGTKSAAERVKNVKGCFSVKFPESVRKKNILLVDDVVTSGATILEAATVLKAAGARKIVAMAVARA